jgi:hypothetical protein
MPLASCFRGIDGQTSVAALVAASMTSWVWSTSVWMASLALVGGTRGSECCSVAAKSGHAGGYLALGLGCSKRTEIGPWVEPADMRNPLLVFGGGSSLRSGSLFLLLFLWFGVLDFRGLQAVELCKMVVMLEVWRETQIQIEVKVI